MDELFGFSATDLELAVWLCVAHERRLSFEKQYHRASPHDYCKFAYSVRSSPINCNGSSDLTMSSVLTLTKE